MPVIDTELVVRYFTHSAVSDQPNSTGTGADVFSREHAAVCSYSAGVALVHALFNGGDGQVSVHQDTIDAMAEGDRP